MLHHLIYKYSPYKFCLVILLSALFCNNSFSQNKAAKEKLATPVPVDIQITTHLGDQQTFIKDDIISFFISVNHDAYLYAFYQDASDNVFQLIPGNALKSHYFSAGYFIPFPPASSNLLFQVQAPYGQEHLWVFATNNGELKFKGNEMSNGLLLLESSVNKISHTLKNNSDKLYGFSKLIINTRDK